MTRGEVVAQIQSILRRSDCSDALATMFLGQGISRVQRQLRVPSMERVSYVDAVLAPIQSFELPPDCLQVIDVLANGKPLSKIAYRQMLTKAFCQTPTGSWVAGQPCDYARIGAQLFMLPTLAQQGQAMVIYYGTLSDLPDATSANEGTTSFPDLLIYAALSFAGDYFRHDQAQAWEARCQTLLTETQDQATQLDAMGGSEAVQAAYGDC